MTLKTVSVRKQAPQQQEVKVEVQVLPFFTAALNKGSSQVHSPDNSPRGKGSGTHWMSPRTGLDTPLARRGNHVTRVPAEF